MSTASVEALFRYPVKGFSAERLETAGLLPGETILNDRAFAIENGASGFDPGNPAWLPKVKFLCLMSIPELAALETRFDDASSRFSLRAPDGRQVSGDLRTPEGQEAVVSFLEGFLQTGKRGPLRVLRAPGHSFSDVAAKVVSLINLASAQEIEGRVGATVDPVRFRGNVYVAGLEPWVEATWLGRTLGIGDARLTVTKTIQRCLATHVGPKAGVRDMDVMGTIRALRGDLDCGIYARVVEPGTIRSGDELRVLD
jgi:uncharacterized protein YcbX